MTEIDFHKLKIGYAIANEDINIPAYRRRFGYYLKRRGISWEVADIRKSYDLVVVHHSSDITAWKDYDKAKIIMDYNDDYLSGGIRRDVKNRGRGLAKFVLRQWSGLELDYRNAYTKMMARADAIVCCTDAQEADARKYCVKVHQISDMQSDPDWIVKEKYDSGSTFNIVWEGLPGFEGIVTLVPTLRSFQAKHDSALHLITALKHGKYLRNVYQVHTKDEIARQLKLDNVFLYEWNPYLFSHIATACDLAIIPIDMSVPFLASKPSNKLISFWRLAMPTLVSPTPAYVKLMNECELDMVCCSPEEWREKLDFFFVNKEARRKTGTRGRQFVDENYSEEKLLEKWDEVLYSLLGN